jgi:NAD(P)H-dependent flavin oxidoreductase YrpB (nitropropane dioxygenase family)
VSDQTYSLPVVIQGGMGIAVSSWQLAKAVSQTGQLGVVSGTAIDSVFARRLQNGDPTGDLRRAIANFPFPEVGRRVRDRYFRPEGRKSGHQYMAAPKLTLKPSSEALELLVLSNFAEVWLAKEGHAGLVGINYLEKIQMATPSSAYGAMLAGVDYVLMGAGIPAEIPQLLNNLAQHEAASLNVQVDGSTISYKTTFYPKTFSHHELPALHRPNFLAIISAHVLATYLARDEVTRPDGFIIEGAVAGGHNAPPRGHMVLDENGEPIFGPRDEPDIGKVAKIGLPFWLAGGYSSPADVSRAISMGAAGVQVGTLFSLAHETGLTAKLRAELMAHLNAGDLIVRTDPYASPTGDLYAERPRLCDLGYLRVPYERSPGTVGYRCSAEPTHVFLRKGGSEADALGRKCLCNGLMANIGLEQTRGTGYTELPLLTLGADLSGVLEMLKDYPDGWSAEEAVRYLLKVSVEQGSMPLAAVPVLDRRV